MAENSFIFNPGDPATDGTMETGVFSTRIINSGGGTESDAGIKVGQDTHVFRTLIFGKLPQVYDVFATTPEGAFWDKDLTITNMTLTFTVTDADTSQKMYLISEINEGQTVNYPVHDHYGEGGTAATGTTVGNATYDRLIHDASNSGAGLSWTGTSGTGNITTAGVVADDPIDYFRPDATGVVVLDLKSYVKAKTLTWGDRFNFIIEKVDASSTGGHMEVDDTSGGYADRTTNDWADLTIYYEDPEPTITITTLSADSDYIGAVFTFNTKPEERHIISFDTIWKAGAPDTTTGKKGVDYTTSATYRAQDFTLSGTTLKQNDSQITSTYLATEGQEYSAVVYAKDATGKSMGNVMQHTRMSCTGSVSPSPPTIGQEATLTISGFSDAGNSSAKAFTKFGVNWDGEATASNDNINDYTIITLDSEVTSTTVKHTFDKAGTYKVNVCVIDEKGFRTDFTQAASLVVAESNPVAVLRSSRDSFVRARYGDEFSVGNLSLSHSYPVGSDRLLMTHKFKHNSNTPITTFPMDNDNSNFNDASTSIAVKCNKASCDDTVIKVFGKVSVDSAGDPIADDHANFDHYEYQVNSVSPNALSDVIGGVATTTASDGSTDAVYYKQVDFVVISTLSGDDDGVLYTLVDIVSTHSSGQSATSGYGNIINNKIRGKKDTYAWGGYEDLTANITAVNFDESAGTVTRVSGSGDFVTNGATIGDTIYIAAPENAGNNGFFTLSAVTGTVLTVNETFVADDNSDSAAEIYKVGPSVLPIASYDGNEATITGSVVSTIEGQSTTANLDTSSEVTQDIRIENETQNTLDLDTTADAGDIAILSANISRGGGMAAKMPLGNKIYPTGAVRTRMGNPNVSLNVRALTQGGYRKLWNLIEGDTYEWVTIDSKKVDVPSTAYKQLRMRLTNGSLNKDPSMASQYTSTLNFVVIGELVT